VRRNPREQSLGCLDLPRAELPQPQAPRSADQRKKRPQAASTQGRKPASTEYIYMPLGRKHEAARGRKAAPTQTP